MHGASFPLLQSDGKTQLIRLLDAKTALSSSFPTPLWLRDARFPLPFVLEVPSAPGVACALELVGFVRSRSVQSREPAALVHLPGMPGGIVVEKSSFDAHASMMRPSSTPLSTSEELQLPMSYAATAASRTLKGQLQEVIPAATAATTRSLGPGCFLRHVGRQLCDWATVSQGVDVLYEKAAGLKLVHRFKPTFPYHVPSGPKGATTRSFFDVSPHACAGFGEGFRHGQKRLSRWGVATCVGVASAALQDGDPLLHWHVAGKTGATIAPELQVLASIEVGEVMLHVGGPRTTDVDLLAPEELSRYCHFEDDSRLDRTKWLAQGLFGIAPGTEFQPGIIAEGVIVDDDGRLEMICRRIGVDLPTDTGTTGATPSLTRLTDLRIYGDAAFTLAAWHAPCK